MRPLIEITTVPIQIEVKTTSAKWEHVQGTAEMEVSKSDGGVSVRSRSVRVNLDTYEPGMASALRAQPAYEATAAYTGPGRLTMETQFAQLPQGTAAQGAAASLQGAVLAQSLPQTQGAAGLRSGGQGDVGTAREGAGREAAALQPGLDTGALSVRYEMDKLNFDWKLSQGDFEFIPGDIEFTVTQRPEVIIKYIGGPLYVPPSADPNYEGVDVQA